MRIKEHFSKVKKIIVSDEMDLVYRILALTVALCLILAFVFTKKNQQPKASDIRVQVKGAVVNPGVYTLKSGSRVDDLIKAAGGTSENADTDEINGAEYVLDAEEIYIPQKAAPTNNPELTNINTADEQALIALPGIGPALAKRIIQYRAKYGDFASTEAIMNVKGIGDSLYSKIKNLITVH